MNIENLLEDSDSSDEDYIPAEKEDVSEVESDGDPEEPLSDSEDSKNKGKKRRKTKRKKKIKDVPEIGNVSKFICKCLRIGFPYLYLFTLFI